MMDAAQAKQDTTQDLVEGLMDAFTFSPPDINLTSPVNDPVLANDTYAAVVWTVNATHTGNFLGIEATGLEIVIEGVTIIQQQPGQAPRFLRFVDWSEVFGQLGVTLTGRPLGP